MRAWRGFRAAPDWKWLVVSALFGFGIIGGVVNTVHPTNGESRASDVAGLVVAVVIAVGALLRYLRLRRRR